MLLARLRPGGDLQRLELQNLIMRSLAERLLSPTAVFKFPRLIASFRDSVQTDLRQLEISRLLCLRRKMDREKIDLLSFPETLFRSERVRDPVLGSTAILDADFAVLTEYVEKFSNGSWREPKEHIREDITP